YSKQRQEENQNRKFEDQPHAHHHIKEKLEVVAHRDHGLHVMPEPDTQKEYQAVTEDNEVRENASQYEQSGGAKDKGRGPASLAAVQAGRDEGPNLVQNDRRAKENRANNRHLEPDDVEGFHRLDLHQILLNRHVRILPGDFLEGAHRRLGNEFPK